MQWTEEQINQLAPNDSTERRARQLATVSRWNNLSTNQLGIWGHCTGSGSQAYQVQIHLTGPKFNCSCPVRKSPCKHSLALLYLYAKSRALFKQDQPPTAIAQWLDRQGAPAPVATAPTPTKSAEELTKAARAKERRWQQRLDLMQSGIDELEQWLSDLVRQGIANTDATQKSFWDQAAAKMVDAKLPSLGSFLKETYQILRANSDWAALVVQRLGVLYSLTQAFQHREQLPESIAQELYARLGKTTTKAQVIEQGKHQTDTWLVAAVREDEDVEGRTFRKVWLWGLKTNQWALLLEFSFGAVAYEHNYPLGSTWQGTLAFYSSVYPQRATWVHTEPQPPVEHLIPTVPTLSLDDLLIRYSQALQQHPWLPNTAVALSKIQVGFNPRQQLLLFQDQQVLPCAVLPEATQWTLLAISGGHPVDLIGEWDGQVFLPLSWLDEMGMVQIL